MSFCAGIECGRTEAEAGGWNDADWREEAALQQPKGSPWTHRGGDGSLPHETLPSRWPHGPFPGAVNDSFFFFHQPQRSHSLGYKSDTAESETIVFKQIMGKVLF